LKSKGFKAFLLFVFVGEKSSFFQNTLKKLFPCTNHIKLRAQKCLHPAARINDMAGLFVHVSVHCHLHIRMSGAGLKRFDVSTCTCRVGERAMPEDMSSGIVKVERASGGGRPLQDR